MEKRVLVGVLLVLSILAAGNAFAATIHVSLPTYVTVNDKYDRNPSPFFSAGNYWVFYTKADSATGIRSGNYLDKDKYVIYYKTASTVEGLNAAPEIRIDPSAPPTRPAGFSQRVASGIVFDDGDILVVTSNGRDNSTDDHLYTYSYDSATATWSGPSQIVTTPWGTTGGHVRTAYNGATIYLVLQGTDDQSYIIKSTNRGATWTSPVLISSDNQPSIATYGGVLYVASIGDTSPMPIRLHKSIDDGATWTYVSDVNGLVDFYDPAVFFLNGALTVAFAPYNEPPKDRQYLVISRSPDSGLTWSSEKYVTNGGYGSNYWWDFWPAALSDGTNTYLFYTSEKSGQAMGDADIAFLKLDWNVEENHFEAIQPAVDYASNGDTISVAPGTYIETIKPASKDGLTIIGDATNKPIVDAGINFANTGDINGITFENLILKGNTFPGASPDIISMENSGAVYDLKINNCVFDGGKVSGKMGMVGENLAGTFTITNNEFKDIWGWAVLDVDDDATPPSGRNTLVFTDVILSNNNIHDCDGSIALRGNDVTRTQHVTVNGNTWSNIGGHGTENSQWAALEANHADSLIVHDNTVEGVKQGDGGEGQAFQFWDIGTIDFHDNTIKNNYQGVYFFGGSHIDPCGGPYALPSGSLYNNNIFGNTMYGLSVEATNTGGPLNAERNWWGDFSGPYNAISNSAGAGNAVSDNVDFDPWLCESAPSIWDTFNEKCDKDHDGYAATGYGGDDCKDNDPAINSGATETCNSIDDNCNNLVDEASNANDCKGTCEIYYAGSGYVWTGNGGAFNCCGNDPGEAGPYEATETTCDGRDNDCNGQIDEGLLTTYFKDNDGDTYGDPANSVQACTQPAGYVARAGDCVDTNDLVNPGMTETCNGIDDNCDGVIDEEGAVHCVNYYQDGDGDTYGTSSVHCYCAPTGVYTATRNGDCVDTKDLFNPGAAEV